MLHVKSKKCNDDQDWKMKKPNNSCKDRTYIQWLVLRMHNKRFPFRQWLKSLHLCECKKKSWLFELFKTKFLPAFFPICLAVPKNALKSAKNIHNRYIYLPTRWLWISLFFCALHILVRSLQVNRNHALFGGILYLERNQMNRNEPSILSQSQHNSHTKELNTVLQKISITSNTFCMAKRT